MRSHGWRGACRLIEPYLKADGLVGGVQNGMTTDVIAEVVGAQRTMGCVIEVSSTMFDPGVVQRASGSSKKQSVRRTAGPARPVQAQAYVGAAK